ncbi:hypothetical protein HGRIS_012393 [Hohenbuehelia grisea]|uniref:Uncharacterized protein n=1 Tax=Hohenbuehelia grisea TaxID=104357 RepID=A0ABR3IS57_9AGAR
MLTDDKCRAILRWVRNVQEQTEAADCSTEPDLNDESDSYSSVYDSEDGGSVGLSASQEILRKELPPPRRRANPDGHPAGPRKAESSSPTHVPKQGESFDPVIQLFSAELRSVVAACLTTTERITETSSQNPLSRFPSLECAICGEFMTMPVLLDCQHHFATDVFAPGLDSYKTWPRVSRSHTWISLQQSRGPPDISAIPAASSPTPSRPTSSLRALLPPYKTPGVNEV